MRTSTKRFRPKDAALRPANLFDQPVSRHVKCVSFAEIHGYIVESHVSRTTPEADPGPVALNLVYCTTVRSPQREMRPGENQLPLYISDKADASFETIVGFAFVALVLAQ